MKPPVALTFSLLVFSVSPALFTSPCSAVTTTIDEPDPDAGDARAARGDDAAGDDGSALDELGDAGAGTCTDPETQLRLAIAGGSSSLLQAAATQLSATLTSDEMTYLGNLDWSKETDAELSSDATVNKGVAALDALVSSTCPDGYTTLRDRARDWSFVQSAYADESTACNVSGGNANAITNGSTAVASLAACAITNVAIPVCVAGTLIAVWLVRHSQTQCTTPDAGDDAGDAEATATDSSVIAPPSH